MRSKIRIDFSVFSVSSVAERISPVRFAQGTRQRSALPGRNQSAQNFEEGGLPLAFQDGLPLHRRRSAPAAGGHHRTPSDRPFFPPITLPFRRPPFAQVCFIDAKPPALISSATWPEEGRDAL